MSDFLTKLICLCGIVVLLLTYNQRLEVRAKDEQIAKLQADLQSAQESGADGAQASGSYRDGTYEGSGQGFGGPIKVQVRVEKGRISAVEVLSHEGEDTTFFNIAAPLTDKIVEAQSADIDTMSGATYSSKGILAAAKDALKKAQ